MALSKQITSSTTFMKFIRWAQSQGYHVGEMHGITTVAPWVHTKNSWHNDKDAKTGMGLAADINFGKNGPAEKAKLITAMHYARSLGIAVTLAWKGTVGTANNHKNHLHVDVGEWSNIGEGLIRARVVPLPQGVVIPGLDKPAPSKPAPKPPVSPTTLRNGSKGAKVGDLQRGLNRVFPAYSKLAADNIYGPRTTTVVKEFQRRVGITVDGIVGKDTRAHLKKNGITL